MAVRFNRITERWRRPSALPRLVRSISLSPNPSNILNLQQKCTLESVQIGVYGVPYLVDTNLNAEHILGDFLIFMMIFFL